MNKTKIALLISAVGHPFVMIVLLVLLLSWVMDPAGAWRITGFVAVMGLIPTGWLAWRSFARERVLQGNSSGDASLSSARPILYLTMLTVLLLSSAYFQFVEHSAFLVRGSLVTATMVAVAAMLNRWLRLSLHVAFAVYSGLILTHIQPACGLPILLLAPVLAWSRLVLLRHTLPEVIGGSILGLVSAVILTGF